MHRFDACVHWTRNPDEDFTGNTYSRRHHWSFDGGARIDASPTPLVVPEPWSDPTAVDPEEALVASASSCHMLFFLALAECYIANSLRCEVVVESP